MVEPTIDELLTKADSKYSLVCAARQTGQRDCRRCRTDE